MSPSSWLRRQPAARPAPGRGLPVVLFCALALLPARFASAAAAAAVDASQIATRAKALQDELMAPCCWRQTLAVHDSPISDSLRAEIQTRLLAGETEDAIRADFVKRYGDRIKVHPDGFSVGWFALAVFGLAAVIGGVPLGLAVRSRRERAKAAAAASGEGRANDAPLAPGPGASTSVAAAAIETPDQRQRRLEEKLQAELDEMDA